MDFGNIFGPLVTVLLAAVGGIVWLVRLEGRISTEKELRLALENRLNGFEQRISASLERIERKLDEKQDK